MKNVILSLEDHNIYIPKGYNLSDAATYMSLVTAWAYKRNFLETSFYKSNDFEKQFDNMVNKEIPIIQFVTNTLHGKLNEEDFIPSLREFVSDYVETGVFYKQVCLYFNISNIFELTKDWEQCSLFIPEIESHYLDVKDNY